MAANKLDHELEQAQWERDTAQAREREAVELLESVIPKASEVLQWEPHKKARAFLASRSAPLPPGDADLDRLTNEVMTGIDRETRVFSKPEHEPNIPVASPPQPGEGSATRPGDPSSDGYDLESCGGCGDPCIIWRGEGKLYAEDECAWLVEDDPRYGKSWVFDCKNQDPREGRPSTPGTTPCEACDGSKLDIDLLPEAHDCPACGGTGRSPEVSSPTLDEIGNSHLGAATGFHMHADETTGDNLFFPADNCPRCPGRSPPTKETDAKR